MTRRDDSVPLRHMLDHAHEAMEMASGRVRADLDRDRQFSLALLKIVEIIGEAASRVSDETQAAHAQVPWGQIIGTRNRLIHGYDRVNLDILWRIVHDDLPVLAKQLETILTDQGNAGS